MLTTDSSLDDQAFFQFAEARQESALSALQTVSIHFNRTRFKDAACLQYDGILRDTLATGSEREFLSMKGYLPSPDISRSGSPIGVYSVLGVTNAARHGACARGGRGLLQLSGARR